MSFAIFLNTYSGITFLLKGDRKGIPGGGGKDYPVFARKERHCVSVVELQLTELETWE